MNGGVHLSPMKGALDLAPRHPARCRQSTRRLEGADETAFPGAVGRGTRALVGDAEVTGLRTAERRIFEDVVPKLELPANIKRIRPHVVAIDVAAIKGSKRHGASKEDVAVALDIFII
jgi:hypothetical protein